MSGPLSTLQLRRNLGLCARCAHKLTERERALEGIGGSFVRCDRCTEELKQLPPEKWRETEDV